MTEHAAEDVARMAATARRHILCGGGTHDRRQQMPAAVCEALAADEDVRVRQAVAVNRKCPSEVLGRLAADRDERVRFAVAFGYNTPTEVLVSLAEDADLAVRRCAAEALGLPPTDPQVWLERGWTVQMLLDAIRGGLSPVEWHVLDPTDSGTSQTLTAMAALSDETEG